MTAVSKTNQEVEKKPKVQLEINNSSHTLHLAKVLAKFIKEKKLCTSIQGRDFVGVDGWQFAGSMLGIVPIVEGIENVSEGEEIKYQAKVKLFNIRTNQDMGYGYAICSNKEGNKKKWDEYAIASMSQTRAIGKAYRNVLSWIIKAAGYEATPYEEVENVEIIDEPKKDTKSLNQVFKFTNLLMEEVITLEEQTYFYEKWQTLGYEEAQTALDKLEKLINKRIPTHQ